MDSARSRSPPARESWSRLSAYDEGNRDGGAERDGAEQD